MPIYTKESLETLRQKIDLIEVLEPHLSFKKSGASYTALCPFHGEKTPSFTVQKGAKHYHCFGCQAHGDAIQFLMEHVGYSFQEAIAYLSDLFHVPLEEVEGKEEMFSTKELKSVLAEAQDLYHQWLLHAEESREALVYLARRGIDLPFIRRFKLGLAPNRQPFLLHYFRSKNVSLDILEKAGLIKKTQNGKWVDFFIDRIMFPLHDPMQQVLGFSARKYKETTFGGKYINTKETPLFKKSNVLFGLSVSKKRIIKEQKVVLVEGQLDALRLIDQGLTMTVASLGTAFGTSHVQQLVQFGVQQVFIAFDADGAGLEAAEKVGDLFQAKGVDVFVVRLPQGEDPDQFVQKRGIEQFLEQMRGSQDYLSFVVEERLRRIDTSSPAEKNRVAQELSTQVHAWEEEVMVYESIKKLSQLLKVPEHLFTGGKQVFLSSFYQTTSKQAPVQVDPDQVLEGEFLLWLFRLGQSDKELCKLAFTKIQEKHLKFPFSKKAYALFCKGGAVEMLELMQLDPESGKFFFDMLEKKLHMEKKEELFPVVIKKLLDRYQLEEREKIRLKLSDPKLEETEALQLAKEFASLL